MHMSQRVVGGGAVLGWLLIGLAGCGPRAESPKLQLEQSRPIQAKVAQLTAVEFDGVRLENGQTELGVESGKAHELTGELVVSAEMARGLMTGWREQRNGNMSSVGSIVSVAGVPTRQVMAFLKKQGDSADKQWLPDEIWVDVRRKAGSPTAGGAPNDADELYELRYPLVGPALKGNYTLELCVVDFGQPSKSPRGQVPVEYPIFRQEVVVK